MNRIHRLLADIDTAWAQGDRGNTEQPVELLIELTGMLAQEVEKLRTRQERLERQITGMYADLNQMRLREQKKEQ